MAGKVIITCALTGSGHTPSMSPYLPYTVGDVTDRGVAAAKRTADRLLGDAYQWSTLRAGRYQLGLKGLDNVGY